jgi:hypothetical protein
VGRPYMQVVYVVLPSAAFGEVPELPAAPPTGWPTTAAT